MIDVFDGAAADGDSFPVDGALQIGKLLRGQPGARLRRHVAVAAAAARCDARVDQRDQRRPVEPGTGRAAAHRRGPRGADQPGAAHPPRREQRLGAAVAERVDVEQPGTAGVEVRPVIEVAHGKALRLIAHGLRRHRRVVCDQRIGHRSEPRQLGDDAGVRRRAVIGRQPERKGKLIDRQSHRCRRITFEDSL